MKRTPKFPKHNAEALLLAHNLSDAEARFLTTDYYAMQEARKRADMQLRHLGDRANEANAPLLQYTAECNAEIEQVLLRALERYAMASPIGRWILKQHGFGPVLAAGFMAHLSNIEAAPTVGHWWRFAGQDPSCKWEKGEKRPYNAQLKQLVYHAGECIKRTWKSPDSFYGPIYAERKAYVVAKNDRGDNAERAKTFRTASADVRKTLAKGKLPDGNLDRQACNQTVKIFLSHLHAVMYWSRFGKAPPKPFAIAILGHAHEYKIPDIDLFPGLAEAYYGTPPAACAVSTEVEVRELEDA